MRASQATLFKHVVAFAEMLAFRWREMGAVNRPRGLEWSPEAAGLAPTQPLRPLAHVCTCVIPPAPVNGWMKWRGL